ncbi:MAG: magnesium transporter [Syntrophaceticus sp.]|nr:magnesium transporter [Syntrophaceticus sp.]MDD3314704.1 magnesium transporter [Syntrophaceticus sp.]MDD4360188.1 magnesium transporter [Syntrophaceticus sp.]MDD4783649.1 magnesium transporter [Syntrophaceticus sp.]
MDQQELERLTGEKKYLVLKEKLEKTNEVDIAELLEPLDINTTLLIFRMLPKDVAVDVFAHFSIEKQKDFVGLATNEELKEIVDELFFDDMIDLIEEMPANIVKKILQHTSKEQRGLINQFLRYPPDSAGSIMTIEYVDLKKAMTVKDALSYIRKIGLEKETIYTCYVTDKNRKLEGIVSLRKLVTSDEYDLIENIMDQDVIYVHTHDDQEAVAAVFKRYGFLALPVVDKEDRLTGIITFDDIMLVIDQEATEDFQKMAAMAPTEEKYLDTDILTLAKHRLPWLIFLMLAAIFTEGIIRKFEGFLEAVVVLAAFIPMLMNTGGNSGSQSSTLIIRGLALGEIDLKDVGKVMWKEFRISIVVGIILATVNFIRIYLFSGVGLTIALTVSITLLIVVVLSKVIGGTLPILAKRINLDPAVMAGPFITTIVDVLCLIVYFSVAAWLLNI